MIKVEPCRGCGRLLMIQPVANLEVRLESEPLDAPQATRALLAGRNLWRVTGTSAKGARPIELAALRDRGATEGPHIVQEHLCARTAQEALSRPRSSSVGKETGPVPKGRPAAPGAPSPVRSTERSSARSADRPLFEIDWSKVGKDAGPRCPDCGLLMEDGEYVSAQLGEIYVWAVHLTGCRRP